MEALFEQLKTLTTSAGASARRTLVAQLQTLQRELEEPADALWRVYNLNCELALVRVGIDLKIFNRLVEHRGALTVAQLAETTGADVTLMGRIMRYLACTGYVKEEGHDLFSANRLTASLTEPANQAGVHHHFEILGPIYQGLPDFFKETNYRNVTDPSKTPLHYAFKTDLMPWEWFQLNPERAKTFATWIESRNKGRPDWIPTYPVESRGRGVSADAPLFVDVGSGFGQQARLLRDTYPHLTGRVFVEDFPPVLANAPDRDDVVKLPHDFFKPQPPEVHGARFYYLHQVLHDHSDEQAALILKNLKDAMGPDSCILIDEIVIPNTGADSQDVHLDMAVMCGPAGMERSRAQWDHLLEGVGLHIVGAYPYNPGTSDTVLEVVARV